MRQRGRGIVDHLLDGGEESSNSTRECEESGDGGKGPSGLVSVVHINLREPRDNHQRRGREGKKVLWKGEGGGDRGGRTRYSGGVLKARAVRRANPPLRVSM
jgi:hypothetical protein